MAGYAASRGLPSAEFLVVAAGVQIAAGSVMVALGLWPDLGDADPVVFLVPTAFLIHPFWKESGPQSGR
jgi:putative oxidoreductase